MAPDPRVMAHERDSARSYSNLSKACLDAHRNRPGGYNSDSHRDALVQEFKKRLPGMEPYEWQLDVAEALGLGLDCTVIAGTGAGKTMPFVMPLFVAKGKIVIIISPLNALEEDQAKKFNAMGLSAVAVNKDTYTKKVHKAIKNNLHNVIITSPELCLEHDCFRSLLSDVKFSKNILSIIIDECHCITQWGEKFRPIYQDLGTLRSFITINIPFLVTSATLTPVALAQVHKTVHMHSLDNFQLNMGTDRSNISWFVRCMKAGKSDLDSLNFVLKKKPEDIEVTDLLSTMVFFDDINVALEALKHLRDRLPRTLRGQIACYSSRRSTRSKRRVLQEFAEGKIKILLTTEAAGMGCDIPNIERVVQFMVPPSLSIWLQRAGRAGRNRSIKAQAFLLVQPTVFQEMKSKGTVDEGVIYKKDVEASLRRWIETEDCRREPQAEELNDFKPRTVPSGFCCDNCLRKQDPTNSLLHIDTDTSSTTTASLSSVPPPHPEEPSSETNANGKRPMTTVAATRKDTHLADVRTALTTWRNTVFLRDYSTCSWGVEALLPAKVLTSIATKARLSTIDDLMNAGWSSLFARQHGSDVIKVIAKVDEKHYKAAQEARDAKRDAKRKEMEEKARIREEEREREKKEREEKKAAEKREREERKEVEKKEREREREEKKAAEKKEREEKKAAEKREKEKQREREKREKEELKETSKREREEQRKVERAEKKLKKENAGTAPSQPLQPRPKPRPRGRPMTRSQKPLLLSPQRNQANVVSETPMQLLSGRPYTPLTPPTTPFAPVYHAHHATVPYGQLYEVPSNSASTFTYFTDPSTSMPLNTDST